MTWHAFAAVLTGGFTAGSLATFALVAHLQHRDQVTP